MKNYIAILALSLLMGGCTLSMEEWVVPEEEQGFDEPYTIETDMGSVTYQFNEGTIYVSENVQEYLVNVEHDSILYFLPNMPEAYRPVVGSKLASGCTHKVPMGLNHRVIAVENTAGLLKVTCTKTSYEDVYKELSYEIDANVETIDLSGLTDEQLESIGYERHDSVIIDWGVHDSIMGIDTEKLQLRRHLMSRLTRATTDEDNYEISDSLVSDVVHDWYVDSRDIKKITTGLGRSYQVWKDITGAVFEQLQRQRNKHALLKDTYYALRFKQMQYTQIHSEKNARKKYELHYTDSWMETTIGAEVGFEVIKKPTSQLTKDKVGKMVKEWAAAGHEMRAIQQHLTLNQRNADLVPNGANSPWNIEPIRVPFSIGPVPLAFIMGMSCTPSISLGGSLCVSGTYSSDKVRTGYEIKSGKRNDFTKTVEKGSFRFDNAVLNGKFKVGIAYRAYAGFEVATALGCTIGINVDTAFEGEAKIDIVGEEDPVTGERDIWDVTGSCRFYCDIYGDVQVHIAPLGIHVWDKQVAKSKTLHILDYNTRLDPNFKNVVGYCNATNTEDFRAYAQYKLESSAALTDGIARIAEYTPGILIYFGPLSDNNTVAMVPNEDSYRVVSGKTYNFTYMGELPEGVTEVHFRPFLVTEDPPFGAPYLIYGDISNVGMAEVGIPEIYTITSGQLGGQPFYDFSYFDDPNRRYVDTENGLMGTEMSLDYTKVHLREYDFYTMVKVLNGSRMQKWGIKVKIFTPEGKQIVSKKIPVNKLKSGVYTIVFNFITNWERGPSSGQQMSYTVMPYWEDLNGGAKHDASDDEASRKRYYLDYSMEYNNDLARYLRKNGTLVEKNVE